MKDKNSISTNSLKQHIKKFENLYRFELENILGKHKNNVFLLSLFQILDSEFLIKESKQVLFKIHKEKKIRALGDKCVKYNQNMAAFIIYAAGYIITIHNKESYENKIYLKLLLTYKNKIKDRYFSLLIKKYFYNLKIEKRQQ